MRVLDGKQIEWQSELVTRLKSHVLIQKGLPALEKALRLVAATGLEPVTKGL
jgi:hypothetical protein